MVFPTLLWGPVDSQDGGVTSLPLTGSKILWWSGGSEAGAGDDM
jgi:hypothetical protein